jgi:hypothetical protein
MEGGTYRSILANPASIAIFVVVVWCLTSYLIGLMTGWLALARRFRAQSEPYGDGKAVGPFFYTIYMRYWTHYSSVIRLTAATDALYASILFPFRIGHPPLRIPWNEIRFGRAQRFMSTYVLLTLGEEEKIPMRISVRMARNLGILDRCPVS